MTMLSSTVSVLFGFAFYLHLIILFMQFYSWKHLDNIHCRDKKFSIEIYDASRLVFLVKL